VNQETIAALREIDRRFYRAAGSEFDASRQAPWGGWRQLLLRLRSLRLTAVLDVGCGNGRFGAFLAAEAVAVERYVGVDSAANLLATARQRVPAGEFIEADVIDHGFSMLAPETRFDFIALFGLLHHVPSSSLRSKLLAQCVARLAPDGILAVTLWRFLDSRTAPQVIPWSECVARCGVAVDGADLEPGDTLLGFGEDRAHVRYAHHFAAAECDSLAAEFGAIDSFEADGDGRSNRYLLIARPPDDHG
jgi:tRNA (uracil-5-)-methyltransferase TRM9